MTGLEKRKVRAIMVRNYLMEVKAPTTYGTLMSAFGIGNYEIKRILGMVVEMDIAAGTPRHSALVVSSKTGKPKDGFAGKCRDEGVVPNGMTDAEFTEKEMKKAKKSAA